MKTLKIDQTSAAIPNGATADIGDEIVLRGTVETMLLEIISADEATDIFEIHFKTHVDGTFVAVQTTFAAVSPILEYYSEDIASLAAAAIGMIRINTTGVYAIKFRASVAANTSGVTVKGMGYSTGSEKR